MRPNGRPQRRRRRASDDFDPVAKADRQRPDPKPVEKVPASGPAQEVPSQPSVSGSAMPFVANKCPYCGEKLEGPAELMNGRIPKVGATTCSKCEQRVYYRNHLMWGLGYTGRPTVFDRTFPKTPKQNEKLRSAYSAERAAQGCAIILVAAASTIGGLCYLLFIMI